MKIEYSITQIRTIRVASGTADGAIAVALAKPPAAWTDRSIEASYVGSAGYDNLPGNEEPASVDAAAWE